MTPRFELVEKFKHCPYLLPTRATKFSAGYDFVVAQDTIVPAWTNQYQSIVMNCGMKQETPIDLEEVSSMTKFSNARPTLVPTGVKAYIPEGQYLQLSVRSSCPLKNWLILANGVGVIDADYYNNPDNEGHIYFQLINLFPHDILLREGDKIGQGIFLPYYTTGESVESLRAGGFGSTTKT